MFADLYKDVFHFEGVSFDVPEPIFRISICVSFIQKRIYKCMPC